MRDVVDPELGINVVDLGLVYGLSIEEGDAGKVALIDMTLTSAACPLTDVIEDQSRTALVGAGAGQRDQDQLGVESAVGPGQDHRGRPRAAAGARLHRLAPPVRPVAYFFGSDATLRSNATSPPSTLVTVTVAS